MRAMKGVSALAVGLAAAGALLLSGCGSSTTAAEPTAAAVASAPAASAPAASAPAASAPAEAVADQVVEVWTCENDGAKTTCT